MYRCHISPDLPPELHKQCNQLCLYRQGRLPTANMTTLSVYGSFQSGHHYRITPKGLEATPHAGLEPSVIGSDMTHTPHAGIRIPRVEITLESAWAMGSTGSTGATGATHHNILGESKRLSLPLPHLEIPGIEATQETLAYYGARLYDEDTIITYDTPGPSLAITSVNIGKDYVTDYLLLPDYGGGAYIECHDTPHFHRPMTTSESPGYYLLAKYNPSDKRLELTGFRIPLGKAIYTPPHIWHSDAFLIGQYEVVYGITDQYQTFCLDSFKIGNPIGVTVVATSTVQKIST